MADGPEEFVAGALNGLGGVEVSGRGGELVEGFEGDAGLEEDFRAGERSEPLAGCGDILLPVGLPDAAAGALPSERNGLDSGLIRARRVDLTQFTAGKENI